MAQREKFIYYLGFNMVVTFIQSFIFKIVI